MAKNVMMMRDEAELVVDLLEDNYKLGSKGPHYDKSGVGADLAAQVREIFGMIPQDF